ncbi:RdRP-domain-containing protein [Delitschia confertaspora ATCC 74209]|uniref:RdRP-domain-containing protein n=1 Tax=Delitschia confertaspora ATCC 74209 TaxID=1513339 RepID=A0A9P4JVE0_9PLEO|nr:RdRP-domain-containing protein [Delitschia confertaspora ATCC 74209]
MDDLKELTNLVFAGTPNTHTPPSASSPQNTPLCTPRSTPPKSSKRPSRMDRRNRGRGGNHRSYGPTAPFQSSSGRPRRSSQPVNGFSHSPSTTNGASGHYNHRGPPGAAPFRPYPTMNGQAAIQSHPKNRGPLLQGGQEWKQQSEVKVKVTNMHDTDARRVYETLHQYGTIVFIDALPERQGSFSAFVVFRPPPNQPFWERYPSIELYAQRPFLVPSPVQPQIKYQEYTVLFAQSVDFGMMVEQTTMMEMHRAVATTNPVQVIMNLKRKEIDVIFFVHLQTTNNYRRMGECKYRFRLPISQLQQIYEVPGDKNRQRSLVIPFNNAPEFFKQTQDILSTFKPSDKKWSDWLTWFRQTEVVPLPIKKRMANTPIPLNNDAAIIDIGRWTTYRLTFDQSTLEGNHYYAFRNALVDHNVQFKQVNIKIVGKSLSRMSEFLHDEFPRLKPEAPPCSQSYLDQLFTDQITLTFPVRYQLEVCLSNGWLNEHNIGYKFLQKLGAMDPEKAGYILEKVADRQTRVYNPMEIFDIPVKGNTVKNVPGYCVLTRAASLTPTMVHVATAVVETSNRIVRAYRQYEERFLRLRFTDEKTIGRLTSQDDNRSEELFHRIRRAMKEGVIICGRHYQFLAFGNSQFREHGAYFFSPCSTVSVDDIRSGMGNFAHIRTPAKYGARIGQCFSTTRAINSTKVEIVEIADIERNNYTFTDGVGKISTFLAQMSALELGLQNPSDDYPSLFQFRLGGCKGVLALDPSLKRQEVHIRPSQYKFPAPQKGLEIIRSSAFATACFNRQLVIVLSTLGVPDNVFLLKQQEMVNGLELATKDERIALQKLQQNIDLNQTTLTMAKMVLDGFMGTKEPFMMSLMQLWRAYNVKFLKEKARIVIEHGAFVLGCIDETATLRGHFENPQSKPGATREEKLATLPEIFIQISDPEKRGFYKVVEGICVLARNPSLHAGDLRIVRAVDVSALHHLKNVVVLPQTGERDIANMCSGGDLDGDDYLVMWDRAFIPTEINDPPMDFTPERPQELDRPVTVDDMVEFFVTYMKNDSLARIALAHLAQADYNAEGVRSPKCLELAALHSQAVDYPKSGIPAIMDRELRPKKFPHFMENKYRTPDKIYKSTKVLGQLYDQVKLVDFKPLYKLEFDNRILDAFELDDATLQKAKELKEDYDSAIRRVMAKHAIRTEFEVWSTFVLQHNQEARDYAFAEELGRTMGALRDQYNELCREAAGAKGSTDYSKIGPFVAAMYTVTAQEMKEALAECHRMKTVGGEKVPVRKMVPEEMPMMSFPWLFVNEMGKIATGSPITNQPALGQQGVSKKVRRHMHYADIASLDPGMGDVETKKGTTHLGDLLMLFDDASERSTWEEASSPNQQDLDHIAMVENNIQGASLGDRPLLMLNPSSMAEPMAHNNYLVKAKALFEEDQAEPKMNELEDCNNYGVLTTCDYTEEYGLPTPNEGTENGGRLAALHNVMGIPGTSGLLTPDEGSANPGLPTPNDGLRGAGLLTPNDEIDEVDYYRAEDEVILIEVDDKPSVLDVLANCSTTKVR